MHWGHRSVSAGRIASVPSMSIKEKCSLRVSACPEPVEGCLCGEPTKEPAGGVKGEDGVVKWRHRLDFSFSSLRVLRALLP